MYNKIFNKLAQFYVLRNHQQHQCRIPIHTYCEKCEWFWWLLFVGSTYSITFTYPSIISNYTAFFIGFRHINIFLFYLTNWRLWWSSYLFLVLNTFFQLQISYKLYVKIQWCAQKKLHWKLWLLVRSFWLSRSVCGMDHHYYHHHDQNDMMIWSSCKK